MAVVIIISIPDWTISVPMGGDIYAAAPGKVVFTGPLLLHGNTTLIDHGWGVYIPVCSSIRVFGPGRTAGQRRRADWTCGFNGAVQRTSPALGESGLGESRLIPWIG